jgi:hypothetical protein
VVFGRDIGNRRAEGTALLRSTQDEAEPAEHRLRMLRTCAKAGVPAFDGETCP